MLLFSSLFCFLTVLLLQSQLFPKLSNNVRANVCAKDSERGKRGGCGGVKRDLVKERGGKKKKTDGIMERQRYESKRRTCKNVMY